MVKKNDEQGNLKRALRGRVLSDKMQKTIVVSVEQVAMDPRFAKVVRKTKKYKVHDEQGQAKIGDLVEIYEGRPVSKEKFMYLARVLESKKEQG